MIVSKCCSNHSEGIMLRNITEDNTSKIKYLIKIIIKEATLPLCNGQRRQILLFREKIIQSGCRP